MSRVFRTYRNVANPAGEDVLAQVDAQQDRLVENLAAVRNVVVVASGKGGVGKSAVTANLAAALAARDLRVGAADADLNGPSLARMLGANDQKLRVLGDGIDPATGACGVRVISMDLLLASDDAPLRWQGPDAPAFLWQSTLEAGALREFLADVHWGALDFLLIDAPPGTDKLIRLLQLLPRIDALLLVSTPSAITHFIVGKSLRLARDVGVDRVGVVLNMAAHVCEACGHHTPLFDDDRGGEKTADRETLAGYPETETWAEVPFDRRLAASTDRGVPFVLAAPSTPASVALRELADRLQRLTPAEAPRPARGGP